MNPAIPFLQQGVDSLFPYFEPGTELLNDQVFGCPTQYSTPYYAWGNAVLAAHLSGAERSEYAARARRGVAVRELQRRLKDVGGYLLNYK